ncbi:Uncharacterized protein APZ42_017613 [Daphnia magna]|uniref:DUF3105 domain-containing protein n=1 Tax=Daphnia magna TaxID=35525 RepID=A0A164ZYT2_9CRUS|nr:Uncharacterized protein APZ42_017613 [Daphnia magna]
MNQTKHCITIGFLIFLELLFMVLCHAEHNSPVSGISNSDPKFLSPLGLLSTPRLLKKDIPEELKDAKHGIVMGVSSEKCDNGKVNITKDWDGSPPPHYCMDTIVQYNSAIPTYEGHRPLWPIFGEYQFVPPQRWLHNIEHGAIVMLYHPCAEPSEILKLKKLVKSCLWKYVITPWNKMSRELPFALVAWGCRLQMAKVDTGIVRYFIRSKAFRGPESHYLKQGQFSVGLIEVSNPPSDPSLDKVLC